MPHPDILKVLKMTPQEWGQLPFHDETRQRLKEKAIAMLNGDEVPVNASSKAIVIQQAILDAEKSGNVTAAGFEQAMIQQAKMFGEAVEELRQWYADLKIQVKQLQENHKDLLDHTRVMEDSRADYTFLIEERCKAMQATIDLLTGEPSGESKGN